MGTFIINKDNEKFSSINRTIRFKAKHFDKIVDISEKTGVSFNKIVNQCLEYALKNLEEPK